MSSSTILVNKQSRGPETRRDELEPREFDAAETWYTREKLVVYNSGANWEVTGVRSGRGANFGYMINGYTTTAENSIVRIAFPFLSSQENLVSLYADGYPCEGCNSSNYGFFSDTGSAHQSFSQLTFPFDDGTVTTAGASPSISSSSTYMWPSCNSSAKGYLFYSITPVYHRDDILFPFDSGATTQNTGAHDGDHKEGTAFNSSTHGYLTGGWDLSTYYSTVERLEFATGTNLARGTMATSDRRQLSSFNSSQHGYIASGRNDSGNLSDTERLTFPFDSGDISDSYTVATAVRYAGCVNSSVAGVIAGGRDSGGSTIADVQQLMFPMDSNWTVAVDISLDTARKRTKGIDGVDFVSQFLDLL